MSDYFDRVQILREYFKTGTTFDYKWRKNQLNAIIRMLQCEKNSICKALSDDLGKSENEAWLTEIGVILHEARYVRRHLWFWMRGRASWTPLFLFPSLSRTRPQPRGTALIISPWNYPFQLTMSPLISSIAAGNTAVIKPSELSPAMARWFDETIPKYLDMRACAVILGGPEQTSELLKEAFDMIFFTGGMRVAKIIAHAAAEHLTPTVLELGGKSPTAVIHSNHIELAAKRIAFAKFLNAGQTCVAPDYVLVQKSLKNEFLAALEKAVEEQFGPDNEPRNFPRIINKKHAERLAGLLGHGEIVEFGGAHDEANLGFAPTIVSIKQDHPLMEEEIFGPILPIIELESSNPTAEAIEIIQKHSHPLACYLFSDDRSDVKAFREVVCGGFCHNEALMHLTNVHLPFGGVGTSGHGASHGYSGFLSFSHIRAELLQMFPIDIPVRFPPYSRKGMALLRFLMR